MSFNKSKIKGFERTAVLHLPLTEALWGMDTETAYSSQPWPRACHPTCSSHNLWWGLSTLLCNLCSLHPCFYTCASSRASTTTKRRLKPEYTEIFVFPRWDHKNAMDVHFSCVLFHLCWKCSFSRFCHYTMRKVNWIRVEITYIDIPSNCALANNLQLGPPR